MGNEEYGTIRTRILTYVADYQILLTRRCAYGCGHCDFRHTASSPPPSRKRVEQMARTAARLGARQITLTAGEGIDELPEIVSVCRYYGFKSWYDYLRSLCRHILEDHPRLGLIPRLDVGYVPYSELRKIQPYLPVARLMLYTADDGLQHRPAMMHSPHLTVRNRTEALAEFGRLGVPVVTGIIVGLGEAPESWDAAAAMVNELHYRHGHIQSFIVEPFHPVPFSPMQNLPPVSDEVFLLALAAIRKRLDPDIVFGARLEMRTDLAFRAADEDVEDFGCFRLGSSEKIFFDVPGQIEALRRQLEMRSCSLVSRLPFIDGFIRSEFGGDLRNNLVRHHRVARKLLACHDEVSAAAEG